MDPRRRGFSDSFNGVQLGNQPLPILSHPTVVAGSRFDSNTFFDNSYRNFSCPQPGLTPNDVVLKYINQMLMEEDMEDKICMLQESLELQAAEKSFYEVFGKKYPPSPELFRRYASQYGESPAESSSGTWSNYITSSCNSGGYFGDTTSIQSPDGYSSQLQGLPSYSISQSFNGSSTRVSSLDGLGVDEASRFLLGETNLVVELEANGMSVHTPKVGAAASYVKVERTDEGEYSSGGSRGRKNLYREDEDVEEKRSSKQAAVSSESPLQSEMFDVVLLCSIGEGQERLESLREALQDGMSKSRGKKQSVKNEVVDLRTLLISYAHAVAADDHRTVNELLKKVRQHSSPFGDGTQRIAHCFANGLEARLAGTGSQIYKGIVSKRTSAADILKAYHLYLVASPFKKMSNFVTNVTIMNLAEKSTRLHVIDFGTLYGGPPKVRITGIEFPQPGFRPAERVEETGRRLAAYAEKFNVPFEYNAIVKKWETITLEELKIDKDEVLVVNFLYRGKNLLDESVSVDSVRNMVLDLIRRINPDIFIHEVVNGAYNAPFFVTRF
ncbi:hypothetical protein DVH24_026753 [Malus domestica]|uniref:Uncharacterized protein n=1 Tax=Malus domestica TaxID=3750 RepID=A0A498K9E3_MALDO|nr:hypothetical protein DVH24_026753 [Malus domestica]